VTKPIARLYLLNDGWQAKVAHLHTRKTWSGPYESPEDALSGIAYSCGRFAITLWANRAELRAAGDPLRLSHSASNGDSHTNVCNFRHDLHLSA
jgi:hypothetical protein